MVGLVAVLTLLGVIVLLVVLVVAIAVILFGRPACGCDMSSFPAVVASFLILVVIFILASIAIPSLISISGTSHLI